MENPPKQGGFFGAKSPRRPVLRRDSEKFWAAIFPPFGGEGGSMGNNFFLRIVFSQDGEKMFVVLSVEEWLNLFDPKNAATRWVAEKCSI